MSYISIHLIYIVEQHEQETAANINAQPPTSSCALLSLSNVQFTCMFTYITCPTLPLISVFLIQIKVEQYDQVATAKLTTQPPTNSAGGHRSANGDHSANVACAILSPSNVQFSRTFAFMTFPTIQIQNRFVFQNS